VRFDRADATAQGSYAVAQRPSSEDGSLSDAFTRQNAVRLSGFLGERLLDEMRERIGAARFNEVDDSGIARESRMDSATVLARLNFLANDERLLAYLRNLTGVAGIGGFLGRVYQFSAEREHYDSWHGDNRDGRLLAMSVNLSTGLIAGGELMLRRKGDVDAALHSYGVPGDALLFRIDEALEHRVMPVTSSIPRTAFAGWYVEAADRSSLLVR
jgi:2OG-Fe(II) oxygenase superfamily